VCAFLGVGVVSFFFFSVGVFGWFGGGGRVVGCFFFFWGWGCGWFFCGGCLGAFLFLVWGGFRGVGFSQFLGVNFRNSVPLLEVTLV